MKLPGLRKLVVVCLAVVACDYSRISAPPADFEFAAITNSCGPADGPAVTIYLVPEPMESLPAPTPHVRFYVARSIEELEDQRWELSGPDAEGAAWYHPTANEFEIATYGALIVNSVSADLTVRGEVNLVFPSGRHIWGGFTARWFSTNIGCI